MARQSPVHYIAPSSISITPNCNESANDISVYLARGAKIGVYSPRAGIDYVDAQAQTWTLRGRNRRLSDSTKPYTIYARLSKTDYTNGYLVFASKNQQGGVWYDKYNYVTPLGLSDVPGATTSADYWYVRLGDVSVPSEAERTLSYDTGILGTALFNTEWGVDPDSLPLRIDVSCTIGGEDAGVNPYVYWGGQLALTAQLVEGWIGTTLQRFTRWSIARDTGDSTADAAWQNTQKVQDFATTGTIELTHQRGAGEVDDFNGAVSTFFTITAWGAAEDGSAQDVVLVQTTVNILAETVEGFQIVCSTEFMSYNPQTHAYTPSDGVKVCLRATDQRGDVTDMTTAQIAAAQLTASYAEVGGSSWTVLSFSNVGGIATATVPASAFQNGKSINVRLVNADSKELARRTIAYVKDGEDSKLREWIFLRSATEITFGTHDHPYPASISGGEVNPTGAAGGSDTNKNQDGWVPQGWWDEQRGTTQSERYEYGAYRNYIQATSTTPAHWGDFTEPSLWSHYGQNGIDAQDVEWAYIRTKTTVPPLIDDDANYTDHNNKAYTADGHLPKVKAGSGGQLSDIEPNNSGSGSKLYECTANPKGVNDDWPYEWEIKRTKGAADATTNKRAWNAYSGSLVLRTDPAFNKYISTILGGATGNATTVANAQKAVLGALDGTTVTDNGLMLTSLIALRKLRSPDLDPTVLENYDTWGGVSGMYNADAKGYGLAAWYGGDMIDREAVQESHASDVPAWVEPAWGTGYRYAKSVDRFDGSGYRAGGNISWDASGNVTIKGTVIRDATYYVGNQDVTAQLSAILNMFEIQTINNVEWVHVKNNRPFYSDSDISAGGAAAGGGGGGGGGASVLWELNDVLANSGNTGVLDAQAGYVLTCVTNGAGLAWKAAPVATTLAGLTDVNLTTAPTDGQVLIYNATSSKWVAGSISGGVQSDWNQSDSTALDYIKNKPTIPTASSTNTGYAAHADDALSAGYIINNGDVTAISGTTTFNAGLRLYSVYNNGYPCTYGNLLRIGGGGLGEMVFGWTADTTTGRLYYRSKRDVQATEWSGWKTLAWTSDIPTVPTKLSDFTNDLVSASVSGSTLTVTIGGSSVSLTDTNTWRPLGTRSTDAAAGNHDHDGTYLKLSGGDMNSGARISFNGGNGYLGNSNNAGWLMVQDICSMNSAGDGVWSIRTNGNAIFTSVYSYGDVTAASDERMKDIVSNVVLDINDIANAPAIKFTWKDKRDELQHVGTIAQYWENILPESVSYKNDVLGFNYGGAAMVGLVSVAKEVVSQGKHSKQQDEQIKELERQLNEANEKIISLESEVERLKAS